MDTKYIRNSFRLLYGMLLLTVIYSCANIGSPNGGPYDETPPKFVSSTPVPNQINYTGKKIEILFDELIQIEKPSENVIITPPQMELPVIRSAGKKAVIELKDTLKPNTTYTNDFTNSISDNNEKNVFENFSFAFSTGDIIDTLEVSGVLLNAENLEPMPGITIGLHNNLEDSAFVKLPFVRTSRTNDKGQFTIRNITPGTYHIFALNDVNRDYKFDQPGEDIAFLDSVIVPSFELTTRQDTTWKDSLTIDTIRTVGYTRFFPDNIELRLFKEKFERQYMVKPERPDEKYFTLRFNTKLDTVPVPVPINFTPEDSTWYFVQQTEGGAAVNYWLADSTVWKQDTLLSEERLPEHPAPANRHGPTGIAPPSGRKAKEEKEGRTRSDRVLRHAGRRSRFDGLVRHDIRHVQRTGIGYQQRYVLPRPEGRYRLEHGRFRLLPRFDQQPELLYQTSVEVWRRIPHRSGFRRYPQPLREVERLLYR